MGRGRGGGRESRRRRERRKERGERRKEEGRKESYALVLYAVAELTCAGQPAMPHDHR